MQHESLIGLIYEAAAAPELWVKVLEGLAEIGDGEGGLLFTKTADGGRHDVPRYVCSPAISRLAAESVEPRWLRLNIRDRLAARREPRFLTDLDAFTIEELDRSPYYVEFLRPRGFGWVASAAIHSVSDDIFVFAVERAHRKGPMEPERVARLNMTQPHLARSALLCAHLGMTRAQTAADALGATGVPAAVLDRSGRAIAANSHLDRCAPAIEIGAKGAIRLTQPRARGLFESALASGRGGKRLLQSIPVAGSGRTLPFIAHLVPLHGSARDLFSRAEWILFATLPSSSSATPDAEILANLFDLTAAEARVARRLVTGDSVAEIARELSVQTNTVRAHLKSVFSKTGVRRQAELASLLARTAGAVSY
jgi:DNA-binding CsgD family transcriptional regulator